MPRLAPLALAPLLLAAACSTPKPAVNDAQPPPASGPAGAALQATAGEPFLLQKDQTARVAGAGVSLTFEEVVSDNRCPANAKCVWAGEAEVRYAVELDGETHRVTLPIPGGLYAASKGHTPVDTLGHRFTLLALQPYPGDPTEAGKPLAALTQVEPGTPD